VIDVEQQGNPRTRQLASLTPEGLQWVKRARFVRSIREHVAAEVSSAPREGELGS